MTIETLKVLAVQLHDWARALEGDGSDKPALELSFELRRQADKVEALADLRRREAARGRMELQK